MRVLVACEFSGVVRDAFLECGYDAISCDVLPTESDGPHLQIDVMKILECGWDLMIAHPPCTYLATSGARWFKDRQQQQHEAIEFVRCLLAAPIPFIAVENPKGVLSTQLRKPDQIIHPWQFGVGETKQTHLWLKNLPRLDATHIVSGRRQHSWLMPDSKNRWKKRSITLAPIAQAMAWQWGKYVYENL